VDSLRKKAERAARGGNGATIDGIEFRRFGRRWKVCLAGWRR
jgi:hypothetical protein